MEGGSEGVTADDSIGTIVWVRRRNGSWWPGRILAPNELALSHLMSPRSGTPVKLLGREDASVDWYNLEKSKRVKAFRCGEFDDCIVKAESCVGAPTKKREKYARREDAILHALELERQQLERRKESTCLEAVRSDEKECGTLAEQSQNCISDRPNDKSQYGHNDCTYSDFLGTKVHLGAGKSGVSGQHTNSEFGTRQPSIEKVRQGNEKNWEDDSTEGAPRMRGLQDFGLRIAQTKKQPIIAMVSEGMGKVVLAENCTCSASCAASAMENGSLMNNNKGSSLSLKRKRSHVRHVEDSSIKRRDRRRLLTQVLQSSAKLPVHCFSDFGGSGADLVQREAKQRGMHALQPKQVKHSSFSLPSNNNSNCTGTYSKRQISPQASQHVSEVKETPSQCLSLMAGNAYGNLLEQQSSNSSEKSGPCSGDQVNETAFTDFQVLPIPVSRIFANELDGRHLQHNIQGHTSLVNKNGLDKADPSSYFSRPKSVEKNTCAVTDGGVSKWKSKGKRNARHVNKKNFESTNERSLVETDNKCNVMISAKSSEDKLYVNEELKIKKVFGRASVEPEASSKIERQLDYCFVPESHQRDDSAKSNTIDLADERHQRTGSSLPRKKAEVQNLLSQERFEIPTNENFQILLPPAWEISKQECLPCDELLQNQRLSQIDSTQVLWEKDEEAFDSGTFPRLTCEAPKYLGQTQFKQHDSLRVPKFLQSSEHTSIESNLFDVQIDAQASHQGEHVPLVSLMSRLNGKAIVGHPIAVEALEDSYADIFLAEYGYLNHSVINSPSYDFDTVEGGTLQPVWRTARRTAMQRTRRSCSLLNDSTNSSHYSTCGNRQLLGKTVYPGILNHKIRCVRKNLSPLRHSSLDKKLPKKFLKKAGLSSQKTRTLSSIAVEHNLTNETNELADPLKMVEVPLVSCIPIKLIFGRIKEAVGSASKSGSHGLSCTSLSAEKP